MTDQVQCPKCGGAMYDNRASKRNPKAPDFKCKDRGCDGVIWPPKGEQGQRSAAPRATAPQPVSAGGYDQQGRDFLDGQEAHETREVQRIQQGATGAEKFGALTKLYAQALSAAVNQVPAACEAAGVTLTAEALVAATATIFIAAKDRGLAA